ncbi:chromosome segregation in meiosis protein 3 [Solanum lycopersicum]|uniref:CCHC-type domain-containing protein n=1 Tax=Solanum lycopersicum TaxID=4081 RepID=A0A3Q7FW63_SOLLC|nr:chromosome segregation in meiosis protein 3 [Solanum lycopersicum]
MEKSGGGGNGSSAPTGCYKCGRPGHWSRDCPSNPSSSDKSNPNTTKYASKTVSDAGDSSVAGGGASDVAGSSASKPKKVPRSMPKLTPEILLSDKGLGYVLRHFPRGFKYRGRGHEVADLGHLLGLYAEWHAGLLPYYSFDQFIHKVEKLGGSKRVKLCMRGLRDRVADGVDPAKLYEPQGQEQEQEINQQEFKDSEPTDYPEDSMQNANPKDDQEIMLNDMWEKAIEEPSQPSNHNIVAADASSAEKDTVNQAPDNVAKSSGVINISEEQRARMEANKLKALQRAAARTAHIKST